MYLVIDRGNTLTKIALFEQDDLRGFWSFSDFSGKDYKNLMEEIKQKFTDFLPISHAIISDVLQQNDLSKLPDAGINLLEFNQKTPLPVKIKYLTPATLGNDRIALATGGSLLFPGEDVLIIGTGTTITYDFINRNKEYLGGGISPGILMRFKALNTFTGKLPLIHPARSAELIGNSTENSILSGVLNGVWSEVAGMVSAYETKFPGLRIIITGGDMNYFDRKLKSNIFAISNLVLRGLKDILRYNVENLH
jgi:type III pantothenate kinase